MKSRVVGLLVVVALCVLSVIAGSQVARAQGQGKVIVPDSTVERPDDVGRRAHTNHVIMVRPDLGGTKPGGETPGSLGCVYQITTTPFSTGCPISTSTALPNGGSGIIAIVDAFDYPTAQNDFDKFSTQFGLPVSTSNVCNGAQPCFVKIYANGVPKRNCGWAQEAALDIEWAHSNAPFAQIVLVEAKSNSFADLLQAVDVATAYVNAHSTIAVKDTNNNTFGAGQVSMSWGGSEFSGEGANDLYFQHTGVVYFASSGDTGGKTIYPSTSPFAVAAGGTSVRRSGGSVGETGWSGSGGGPSAYEALPSYQTGIVSGAKRGTPDFSYDADPNTGVSVYDSTTCQGLSGWLVFGGTSVSSPSLAGVVNLAGHHALDSTSELGTIYSDYSSSTYSNNYRDITSGTAGSFSAKTGWDFVTGVGSDIGTTGK
jgi:subtilase family serine protease